MADAFGQSATRHLQDSQLLLQARRWDNAIYLAGYVVECSFKLLVQVHLGANAAREYCHDVGDLQQEAVPLLRSLFPSLDARLPAITTAGTVLDIDHPMRRYSQTGRWTELEARIAIKRAAEIHAEIIPPLVLDGLVKAEDI